MQQVNRRARGKSARAGPGAGGQRGLDEVPGAEHPGGQPGPGVGLIAGADPDQRSVSNSRSRLRPLWSRDITVPIGQPIMAAISR